MRWVEDTEGAGGEWKAWSGGTQGFGRADDTERVVLDTDIVVEHKV